MKPLARRISGKGLVGQYNIRTTGTIGLSLGLEFDSNDADANGKVNLGAIARLHNVEITPFGTIDFGSSEPSKPKTKIAEPSKG
jgi:hypothetical protein